MVVNGGPNRVASVAALVAAIGFVLQTLLFLLVATGLLGRGPQFVDTPAAQEFDYATYYASLFNYQHGIAWNVAIRDAVGPVAWTAVGILAVLTAIAIRRTLAWVSALVICLGAALAALADLVFATLIGFWRYGGWNTDVPPDMIAAGRSYEGIKTVSTYLQYDGFLVVAAGVLLLAALTGWSTRFRLLLGLLALALVAYVALDWTWPLWHSTQTSRDITALTLGVVLAPTLVLTWARELRRRAAKPAGELSAA